MSWSNCDSVVDTPLRAVAIATTPGAPLKRLTV